MIVMNGRGIHGAVRQKENTGGGLRTVVVAMVFLASGVGEGGIFEGFFQGSIFREWDV